MPTILRRLKMSFAMPRRFRMTVGRKIYALIGLSFIGLVGIAVLDSRELASSLKQQKQIELKHLAELALGIVKEEHAASQKGDIAVADAQKTAMTRVAALRYGNNNYFWINDMQPRMVMHPMKPELNGSDLSANKDPNGKALFVEFVNVVRKDGAGFVPYEWPKPGFDPAIPDRGRAGPAARARRVDVRRAGYHQAAASHDRRDERPRWRQARRRGARHRPARRGRRDGRRGRGVQEQCLRPPGTGGRA